MATVILPAGVSMTEDLLGQILSTCPDSFTCCGHGNCDCPSACWAALPMTIYLTFTGVPSPCSDALPNASYELHKYCGGTVDDTAFLSPATCYCAWMLGTTDLSGYTCMDNGAVVGGGTAAGTKHNQFIRTITVAGAHYDQYLGLYVTTVCSGGTMTLTVYGVLTYICIDDTPGTCTAIAGASGVATANIRTSPMGNLGGYVIAIDGTGHADTDCTSPLPMTLTTVGCNAAGGTTGTVDITT